MDPEANYLRNEKKKKQTNKQKTMKILVGQAVCELLIKTCKLLF